MLIDKVHLEKLSVRFICKMGLGRSSAYLLMFFVFYA